MKRAMLLVMGGGWCAALLCLFVAAVMTPVKARSQQIQVAGTGLAAVEMVSYEGPFWEDGSDEEVADIAALVVENRGTQQVAQGAVVLEWADGRMVFELSALPPGARVLVLEKNRSAFRADLPQDCYGWAKPEDRTSQQVSVTEASVSTLRVESQKAFPALQLLYKHYDEESGMFIGGITYCAEISQLMPGHSKSITPYRYVRGYSKVVGVYASE